MFSNIDQQLVRQLLNDINSHCSDLPLHAHKIWPNPSDKILTHLTFMINRGLIEGVTMPGTIIGPAICVDRITSQGEELLNGSS